MQPVETIVHGDDVIDHFIDIAGAMRRQDVRFGREQVLQGALRALDLAGEYGLLSDIHEDEQIGIGQGLDRPIQTTEGAVGRR